MSLGQLIDLNGNKTNQDKYTAEKRYVKSSIPKGWDGNLILFATSKDQYSKRFKKNSCCGTVKATQYHKNCFPDDIIKNEEGEFINNMIPSVWFTMATFPWRKSQAMAAHRQVVLSCTKEISRI